MKLPRYTGSKILRSLKQRRVFLLTVLCVILVISLVARPANAAVAFRDSATIANGSATTSLSVPMPVGTVVNDVMIALLAVRGGSATTITPPTGWTLINSTNTSVAGTMKSSTYFKVATTTEAGPYIFTFTSNRASASITSYSGVDTANPIDAQGTTNSAATNKTLTAPAITTTVANTMLVALYGYARGSITLTQGSSMTERSDISSTGTTAGVSAGSQDVLQPAIGTSGTKTMTTTGTAALNTGHLIALRPMPSVSQANYRFFQNTNSTTASTPYAATGTPASITGATPFRLRLNLGVASGGTSVTNAALRTYKLQYALRGVDNTCDTSFSGETYADVGPATTVQFYNNATPADGAAYVTSANDPTRAGITAVGQKYEESNPLVVGTTTPANQDMLWDISLTTTGVSAGQTYCMRAIDSNNDSVLSDGYSVIPEFTIPPPTVGQANYRWLANADSLTPGAPLVAQDTATSVGIDIPVRLRERIAVSTATLGVGQGVYKLQYAEKVGTCDVAFSGESYADMYSPIILNQSMDAGSVVADASFGSRGWTNETWAAGQDGASASSSSKSSVATYTNYLDSSNHGFSIPSNATINGIVVSGAFSYQTPNMPGYGIVNDGSTRLIKNGVIQGSDRADGSAPWSGNIWGGQTDLWGSSWTPNDINNANFGVALAATITGDNTNASSATVDNIKITVYYSLPAAAPIEYYDNLTPADGGTISLAANDPTNASRPTIYQTYRETDPYSNTSAVAAGSDGLWDFSLTGHSTALGKTYCFRMVTSTGSLLNTYSQIPELSIVAGGPTLDQQLRGGNSVVGGQKGSLTW